MKKIVISLCLLFTLLAYVSCLEEDFDEYLNDQVERSILKTEKEDKELFKGIGEGLMGTSTQAEKLSECKGGAIALGLFSIAVGTIIQELKDSDYDPRDSTVLAMKATAANGSFVTFYNICLSKLTESNDLTKFYLKMVIIDWEDRFKEIYEDHSDLKKCVDQQVDEKNFEEIGEHIGGVFYLFGESIKSSISMMNILMLLVLLI
jgi:hypothetical protein